MRAAHDVARDAPRGEQDRALEATTREATMTDDSGELDLLRRAGAGDARSLQELFTRYSGRLKRMVKLRLDPRVQGRVDPSDVVQDVLVEADRKLDRYVQERPLPFYPWLRTLAWEHLAKAYRRHLRARPSGIT